MAMTPKPKPGSLSKRSTPAPMPVKPKGMDSKTYAKRLADAKKKVAMMDPALKAKIKDMYPKTTAKSIADKALAPKPKAKGSVAKTFDVKKLKSKQISKSEQNFLDGEKLKAKILKKTGVYKNTAT
jgi:hypothetical protein